MEGLSIDTKLDVILALLVVILLVLLYVVLPSLILVAGVAITFLLVLVGGLWGLAKFGP